MGPQVCERRASEFFGRLDAHGLIGHFTLPGQWGSFLGLGQGGRAPGYHTMRCGIPALICARVMPRSLARFSNSSMYSYALCGWPG